MTMPLLCADADANGPGPVRDSAQRSDVDDG